VGRALAARLPGARALHFGSPDWRAQLASAELGGAVIFHLAARTHGAGHPTAPDYHEDNVVKTQALAQAARAGGARRLVFLSSIKVNGEETHGKPYAAADEPQPEDDYGRSKLEAERALRAVQGLEACIVRSPLVYGPGVRGNLQSLMRLADTPWPLPFASLNNRRSFIHVDDLASLLVGCATHPAAANATFVAAHDEPVSTRRVVAAMRRCLRRPERLFSVPGGVLETLAGLGGAGEKVRRLTRDLEVDVGEAARLPGWKASIGIDEAIEGMVHAYQEARG